jgi:hypothetical protein
MKILSRIGVAVLSLGFILSSACVVRAHTGEENSEAVHLHEVGMLSGYIFMPDEINHREDFSATLLSVRLGYDIKPWLNKIHIDFPGTLQFDLEPYIDPIFKPDNGVEAGSAIMFKYSFPLTKKIMPYAEFGSGLIYTSQQTFNQSTQWNFLDQAGGGIAYMLTDRTSVSVGYRIRHYSNCGIKEPNGGVNSQVIVCGISYLY